MKACIGLGGPLWPLWLDWLMRRQRCTKKLHKAASRLCCFGLLRRQTSPFSPALITSLSPILTNPQKVSFFFLSIFLAILTVGYLSGLAHQSGKVLLSFIAAQSNSRGYNAFCPTKIKLDLLLMHISRLHVRKKYGINYGCRKQFGFEWLKTIWVWVTKNNF